MRFSNRGIGPQNVAAIQNFAGVLKIETFFFLSYHQTAHLKPIKSEARGGGLLDFPVRSSSESGFGGKSNSSSNPLGKASKSDLEFKTAKRSEDESKQQKEWINTSIKSFQFQASFHFILILIFSCDTPVLCSCLDQKQGIST